MTAAPRSAGDCIADAVRSALAAEGDDACVFHAESCGSLVRTIPIEPCTCSLGSLRAALSDYDKAQAWTKKEPHVPGFYWRRERAEPKPIILILDRKGWWHGIGSPTDYRREIPSEFGFEWSGPIEPPPEAP